MRRFILFAAIAVLFPLTGLSQPGQPAKAQSILDAAVQQAASSHRNVFLVFHASWCSWCKKLEGVLASPDVKEQFNRNYVVVWLDVLERTDEKKQTLENPGGGEIMKRLGGEKSGLPFYAVLDGTGRKLIDSNLMPGASNIGFPGSPDEIGQFEKILKQTAPHLTEQQRAGIMKHFAPLSHT